MYGALPLLGLEIENSWIKAVSLGPQGAQARLYELGTASAGDRSSEVEEGLLGVLARLKGDLGVDPSRASVAVAASCHFAFGSFRLAHQTLIAALGGHLPHARLAGIDRLYSLPEAAACPSPLRFVLSRSLGIRALARACGRFDLVVDCGTTSTEAVRCGDDASAEPDAFSLARLKDGRLTWIGAVLTPLDFVVGSAAGWPLVPRMARMGAVTALCMPESALMDGVSARREVAQAVGLDEEILGAAVHDIAREVRHAAITRLASNLGEVIGDRPVAGEVGIMGVGSEFLVRPALAACGLERATDLEALAGVPPNFGAALGLALAARAPEASAPPRGDGGTEGLAIGSRLAVHVPEVAR